MKLGKRLMNTSKHLEIPGSSHFANTYILRGMSKEKKSLGIRDGKKGAVLFRQFCLAISLLRFFDKHIQDEFRL